MSLGSSWLVSARWWDPRWSALSGQSWLRSEVAGEIVGDAVGIQLAGLGEVVGSEVVGDIAGDAVGSELIGEIDGDVV